jgi:hypothetical protein
MCSGFISAKLNCQVSQSTRFSVCFSIGPTFGSTSWWFIDPNESFSVYPRPALGAGIHFGPFCEAYGAQLSASFEVAYGSIGSGIQDISGQKTPEYGPEPLYASIEIRRTPLMLWLTIMSQSRLSPYVRFGAGTAQSQFREDYSSQIGPSLSFERWSFCWGLGGGLRFAVDSSYDISLFLDDWITQQDLLEQLPNGTYNGLHAPFKLSVLGLKVTRSI